MKLMTVSIGACILTLSASLASAQAPAAKKAAPAPANAKAAIEKVLIANEQKANDAVAAGDLAAFKTVIADDAMMIDEGMGLSPVTEFEKVLKPGLLKVTGMKLDGLKVQWVDANTAIVTYTWTGRGTFDGQPVKSPTFASTVWANRGGKWMAIFHQETPKVAMPAPSPAKKK